MNRREFLATGAVPFLGISAPPASAKNCILLWMTGGPSHLDTFDMKPDSPAEIRGPFRPIRTNVPGIEISEIFPRMARQAHRFTLIRSVHCGAAIHGLEVPWARSLSGSFGSKQIRRSGTRGFPNRCLQASRLIESGGRFVTVNMFDSVFDEITWDAHGWGPFGPISAYRDIVGPMYDLAWTALLDDLDARGLLSSTLVVGMGEFGRTPRINPSGGRDHWPHCFTVQMAGGGIRGGEVYGSSDATGSEPRDKPVTPDNIAATIQMALGIPATTHAAPLHELFCS